MAVSTGAKLLPRIKKSMDEVHTYRGRLRITEALVPEGTVPIDTVTRRGADLRNFPFLKFQFSIIP